MEDVRWNKYFEITKTSRPSRTLSFALDAFGEMPIGASAVDLGCGAGRDTLMLLQNGWHVTAIDSSPLVLELPSTPNFQAFAQLLEVQCVDFLQAVWSDAELINAALALPFCYPQNFHKLWEKIASGMKSGGRFSGNFFGPNDSWVSRPHMTFLGREEISSLFTGWKVELLDEIHKDAPSVGEPIKHWHIFDIVARKL